MRLIFFSRSDSFEVTFFRMGKWILGFIGFWPLDPFNRSTRIKVFINLSVLLTAIIGEIRYTWFMRRAPIEALTAICPCLTKLVTWIKLVCFVVYRKELAELLNELFAHLREDTKDTRKNSMISRVSYFTMIWYLWLYFFGISTLCFYNTKPIVFWAFQRWSGHNATWVSLPFQAALPYEDMTQLQDKTLYSFMYCFLAYSGNVTIFGFPGVDGAFMCFALYISVSYQCLQEDFTQTIKRHTTDGRSRTHLKEFQSLSRSNLVYNELSALAVRHLRIIAMFNRFNRVYKLMIVVHFFFAGIVLGVALIDLLLTPGISRTIYVTYAMGVCFQLFTYCYCAENVDESCLNLSETLYFTDWYDCDKRVAKLILLVMIKSQRGSLLSVPFFSPSLPLFAAIIKTSGSYITLLKAFI